MTVRVDSLRRGDLFVAADGTRWTYERRDSANHGAHHAVRDDGHRSAFAGCADVTLSAEGGL